MAGIDDRALLSQLHREWQECLVCGGTAASEGRLSLHHVHKHPRNDVRANLVMLCGDGTRGCHGLVEARDEEALRELGIRIRMERRDVIAYLVEHLGDTQAREWFRLNLSLSL